MKLKINSLYVNSFCPGCEQVHDIALLKDVDGELYFECTECGENFDAQGLIDAIKEFLG